MLWQLVPLIRNIIMNDITGNNMAVIAADELFEVVLRPHCSSWGLVFYIMFAHDVITVSGRDCL